MSGYLPPHGKKGDDGFSEIYDTKRSGYQLTSTVSNTQGEKSYPLVLPSDAIPTKDTFITVNDNDGKELFKFPLISWGLWSWGDVLTYGWGPSSGYDQSLNDDSVEEAFDELKSTLPRVWVDTAEHYGYTDGFSETKFGEVWKKSGIDRDRITFATKYFPTPWRHPWRYPGIVLASKSGSLDRSKVEVIDIYQLHGPSHWGYWPRLETLVDGLAKAYKEGKIKAIGTCNLSYEQVEYIHGLLRKQNIPLVSNQVEFSLARMDPLTTGLIEKCRKLGIITTGYSPLGVGRLSGKYSEKHRPRGNRNFADISWTKLQPIVDELIRIGKKEEKTPSAVALNWVICKGVIPVAGFKNAEQVRDNMECLGWRLSKEDEDSLDRVGLTNAWDWHILKHFQNWWWQQG